MKKLLDVEKEYAYTLDPLRKPLLSIQQGEIATVQTVNAFGRELNDEAELNEAMSSGFHHPLSGPIEIEGVQAGQTVAVQIHDIKLQEYGYQCLSRSTGVLRNRFYDRNFKKIKIANGEVHYDNIIMPLLPIVGVIGTADPKNTRSGRTSTCGGNMDFKEICSGAMVYLPAEYDGGMLYFGDLHANQGVGELSGVAIETSGEVVFSVKAHSFSVPCPVVVNHDHVLVVGFGDTLSEATALATSNLIDMLVDSLNVEDIDAYMLAGAVADVVIGHMTGKVASVGIKISNRILNFPNYLMDEK